MYIARLIFGIGGESLCVAQNAYTTVWFPSSELNFVFGLQLSMSRVGSTINMVTMQRLNSFISQRYNLQDYQELGTSLLIAAATCLFSVGCALVLAYFTRRAKRILKDHESSKAEAASAVPEEKITLQHIIHFPGAIWLICIICVAYYVTVFPFVSLGLVFFERKFHLSVEQAGVVNSLVYIISAAASPLFGAAIDYTGRNLHWVLSSVILTLFCHLLFGFTTGTINPIVIMILMGLSYSILASSLWPLVAYLLPSNQRGTAYGLIQSIQNLGLGVISLFAGYLVDTKGYLFLEVFFTFCLSIAIASTFGLYVWDGLNSNVLNESGKSRRAQANVKSTAIRTVPETEAVQA